MCPRRSSRASRTDPSRTATGRTRSASRIAGLPATAHALCSTSFAATFPGSYDCPVRFPGPAQTPSPALVRKSGRRLVHHPPRMRATLRRCDHRARIAHIRKSPGMLAVGALRGATRGAPDGRAELLCFKNIVDAPALTRRARRPQWAFGFVGYACSSHGCRGRHAQPRPKGDDGFHMSDSSRAQFGYGSSWDADVIGSHGSSDTCIPTRHAPKHAPKP
jgi:hypothetical protein